VLIRRLDPCPVAALAIWIAFAGGICPAGEPRPPVTNPVKLTSAADRAILTNEGVAILVRAGYSDQFILELMYQKQTRFDTSPEALAALAESGLSPRLVRYMIANPQKEELPEPVVMQAPVYTAPLRARRVDGVVVPVGLSGAYHPMGAATGSASYRNVSATAWNIGGGVQGQHAVMPGPPGSSGFVFRTPQIYASPAFTPILVQPRWWQFFQPYWTYQNAGVSAPPMLP